MALFILLCLLIKLAKFLYTKTALVAHSLFLLCQPDLRVNLVGKSFETLIEAKEGLKLLDIHPGPAINPITRIKLKPALYIYRHRIY